MSDRGRHRGVLAAIVLGLALAGCAGSRSDASKPVVAPSLTSTSTATPTATRAAPASPAGSAPLVVDAALLGVLPAQVAGVALLPATDTAAAMISNPELERSASAIAVGMVIAPGNSGNDDVAISTVVQLRPGMTSDAFYEEWRRAYDDAACQPAGGVSSHAQQQIGSHAVEVTLCGGGARLSHTRLSGDRLVSITAVGDQRFGDLVIAGLRE